MTSETLKRSRNWRASREEQLYQNDKNFRLLEKMFWYYNRIKKEIAMIREEQKSYYQSGHREGGGSSNHAFISDPTFQISRRHIEKLRCIVLDAEKISEDMIRRPEDWVLVVEKTLSHYPSHSMVRQVLVRRYMQNEPMATTCIDLEINKNKYYMLRNTGLQYAKECAIQLGLIRVFNDGAGTDTDTED